MITTLCTCQAHHQNPACPFHGLLAQYYKVATTIPEEPRPLQSPPSAKERDVLMEAARTVWQSAERERQEIPCYVAINPDGYVEATLLAHNEWAVWHDMTNSGKKEDHQEFERKGWKVVPARIVV